ncbi:hypothetical protein B0G82_2741 [Paraburkholderia sp. BL17N1]|nr:hypothetical protein B0G82_2741 [Paraburkholderia sp. BL17N1]
MSVADRDACCAGADEAWAENCGVSAEGAAGVQAVDRGAPAPVVSGCLQDCCVHCCSCFFLREPSAARVVPAAAHCLRHLAGCTVAQRGDVLHLLNASLAFTALPWIACATPPCHAYPQNRHAAVCPPCRPRHAIIIRPPLLPAVQRVLYVFTAAGACPAFCCMLFRSRLSLIFDQARSAQ